MRRKGGGVLQPLLYQGPLRPGLPLLLPLPLVLPLLPLDRDGGKMTGGVLHLGLLLLQGLLLPLPVLPLVLLLPLPFPVGEAMTVVAPLLLLLPVL